MLRLMIVLLLLIASVWFGGEILHHPGYLLIVYQPWMLQMPVWFALLGLLLFLCLFYLCVNGLDRLHLLGVRIKNWFQLRKQHKFYSQTQAGFAALIETRFKKAEKLFLAGVDQTQEPLINYLGAAKAAHALKAYERREEYIQKAYQVAPKAEVAIGLTQAEFEFEQEHLEQAIATLNRLRQESPRHPHILRLLERAYIQLGDWKNLQDLLPSMRKAKMLTKEHFEQFEKNIYCERFRAADNKSIWDLRQMWHDIPRQFKHNAEVVNAYVQVLISCPLADMKEIEKLIRKTLRREWQGDLVKIYSTLPFGNLNRQLVIVGAWLKMYGPHHEVYLALGRLCARVKLWGKAREYFEKSLALGPDAATSLEYGKLLESLGDMPAAVLQYREGLGVVCR